MVLRVSSTDRAVGKNTCASMSVGPGVRIKDKRA